MAKPPSIFENKVPYFSAAVELDTLVWAQKEFEKLNPMKVDAFLKELVNAKMNDHNRERSRCWEVISKHHEIFRDIAKVLDNADLQAITYDKQEDKKMAHAALEASMNDPNWTK